MKTILHIDFNINDRKNAIRECRQAREEFEKNFRETNIKSFYKYMNSKRKVKVGLANLA